MSGTLLCEECGAVMIRAFRSDYVSCPNLHGKLVQLDKNQKADWRNPRVPGKKQKARNKWMKDIPEAVRVGSIRTAANGACSTVGLYKIGDSPLPYLCQIDSRPEPPVTESLGKIKSGTGWIVRAFTLAVLTEREAKRFAKKVPNGPKEA